MLLARRRRRSRRRAARASSRRATTPRPGGCSSAPRSTSAATPSSPRACSGARSSATPRTRPPPSAWPRRCSPSTATPTSCDDLAELPIGTPAFLALQRSRALAAVAAGDAAAAEAAAAVFAEGGGDPAETAFLERLRALRRPRRARRRRRRSPSRRPRTPCTCSTRSRASRSTSCSSGSCRPCGRRSPTAAMAALTLAELFLARGFYRLAADHAIEAIEVGGPEPRALACLGKAAVAEGLFEDALPVLQAALELDPAQPAMRTLLRRRRAAPGRVAAHYAAGVRRRALLLPLVVSPARARRRPRRTAAPACPRRPRRASRWSAITPAVAGLGAEVIGNDFELRLHLPDGAEVTVNRTAGARPLHQRGGTLTWREHRLRHPTAGRHGCRSASRWPASPSCSTWSASAARRRRRGRRSCSPSSRSASALLRPRLGAGASPVGAFVAMLLGAAGGLIEGRGAVCRRRPLRRRDRAVGAAGAGARRRARSGSAR